MGDLDKLYEQISTLIEQVNSKQTIDLKDFINKELRDIKVTIENEKKRINELELKQEDLRSKYLHLDKASRKNNIIIFGLKNENKNLADFTVKKLNEVLDTNISINNIKDIYTIGKQKHNKPIIVEFISYFTKQNVLKNCRKLKGTNINIAEQLSLDEIKINKILRQHLKEAQEKSSTAYIRGNKLYINGKEYTADQLTNHEQNIVTEDRVEGSTDEGINHEAGKNITKQTKNHSHASQSSDPEAEGRKYIESSTTAERNSARSIKKGNKLLKTSTPKPVKKTNITKNSRT